MSRVYTTRFDFFGVGKESPYVNESLKNRQNERYMNKSSSQKKSRVEQSRERSGWLVGD